MMEQGNSSFQIQDYMEIVLDHFHDGIYITDGKANTVYLNNSYEIISGLGKSEMLGKNMRQLVEKGVISQSGTLAVLETGKSVTVEQSFRTGKRAIITSTPIFREQSKAINNIIMVVTIVREITEIYSIRKELKRKEQQNKHYLTELEKIRRELEGNVEIVAADKKFISLIRLAEKIAMLDKPVLIVGEAGTGKEKLARYVHKHSKKSEFSFVSLDFSILNKENRIGDMLGYVNPKTNEHHMGILESAEGGTLYIEELAELPAELQGMMVSLLEEGSCLTEEGILKFWNIQIIASSRYSIEELKEMEELNQKIMENLSLFPLVIPPLRDRKEDIVPLAKYFLNQYNRKTGEKKKFGRESYLYMLEYYWPGNVQELGNLVERAAIISEGDTIARQDLFMEGKEGYYNEIWKRTPENLSMKQAVAELEAEYMTRAFEKYKNIRDAAKSLGIDSSTFVRKRQRYEEMGLMEKR